MRRNLDEELKIAKIRYEQSEIELEKIRKEVEELKQIKREELERIERESKECIAEYKERLNNDVGFYLANALIIFVILAITALLAVRVFFIISLRSNFL